MSRLRITLILLVVIQVVFTVTETGVDEPEGHANDVSDMTFDESPGSSDNRTTATEDDVLFDDFDSSGSHDGALSIECDMLHGGASLDWTTTPCNFMSVPRDIADDATDEAYTMAAYETVYPPGTDDECSY